MPERPADYAARQATVGALLDGDPAPDAIITSVEEPGNHLN